MAVLLYGYESESADGHSIADRAEQHGRHKVGVRQIRHGKMLCAERQILCRTVEGIGSLGAVVELDIFKEHTAVIYMVLAATPKPLVCGKQIQRRKQCVILSVYRKRLLEVDEMQLGKEKFIAAVRKFMQMDKLTAPLLRELIDRIDVYEVTGTGKNRKQMIKIHYKFVGYLELPSLGSRRNYREETRKGVAVEYVPNARSA